MMWFDPDRKRRPAAKLAEAIAYYEATRGEPPTSALCHPDVFPALNDDPPIPVAPSGVVGRHVLYVGDAT